MPELPEVETIRRGLSGFIKGARITRVSVLCEKSFIGSKEAVENQKIKDIRRRGKALLIDLENGYTMMIHLRMTGQLIYDGKERFAAGHPNENFVDDLPNKQTRVEFDLGNGKLFFNDQRKFGFIKVLKTDEIKNDSFIKKLAPEPWEMSSDEFYERIKKHKKSSIKAVLLDQTIICGLGNIYADETLFASNVHPATKVEKITKKEAKTIHSMADKVMNLSISAGGSTIKDYVKADGTRGNYLDKFARVYGRTGQLCACGAKIEKIKVAGRGTHFCPNCQKEKK